jgi:ketosteroid isomerase-like protein
MTLYTADGVFMPQHSLPAVGREAVRVAYDHVFATIKLNIRFEIDEIQPLSRDCAFARTRSTGQVNVLASDQPAAPEANQELGQ